MKIIYLALAAFAGLAVANPMGDRSLDLALDKRVSILRSRDQVTYSNLYAGCRFEKAMMPMCNADRRDHSV